MLGLIIMKYDFGQIAATARFERSVNVTIFKNHMVKKAS